MDTPPFETFEPKLPRRAAVLRAATTFVRTADAGTPDTKQTETCSYWCDTDGVAQFYECQEYVRACRVNTCPSPPAYREHHRPRKRKHTVADDS